MVQAVFSELGIGDVTPYSSQFHLQNITKHSRSSLGFKMASM